MVNSYIKSPLNYTGGKFKLLDSIIPSFPSSINNFVDLFAGGFNVGINVNANCIFANDQITHLIDLYKFFQETDTQVLLEMISNEIEKYNLTKTNVESYNRLRRDYNSSPNELDLFILTCYSFNHQIRFNSKHKFNTSFGKERSSYNDSIEKNLIRFCDTLHKKNIIFSKNDFREFNFFQLEPGDLVYCDPPYLISTGSYNDGKRGFSDWTPTEDANLLKILDNLTENGVLFALSNVFAHKGLTNDELISWSKKYNVCYLDKKYSNCSYHFKDRDAKTVEVLITNYNI